jgi:hypothetical protein
MASTGRNEPVHRLIAGPCELCESTIGSGRSGALQFADRLCMLQLSPMVGAAPLIATGVIEGAAGISSPTAST